MNILITGGASGLGLAITKQLAAVSSNNLLITYSGSKAVAEELSKESNIESIHCDYSSRQDLNELLLRIEDFSVDAVIHNAFSSFSIKHFHKLTISDFSDGFEKNVLPLIQITQAAVKVFRQKKQGKIVTILTSFLADKPPVGLSQYVATKAYVHSLVKSWASEYNKFNVTSNGVSPSFMLTDMNSDTDERTIEQLEKSSPFGHFVQPNEVAKSVAFMINSSDGINGVNLILNQGSSIK